jgi:branched-chain amino acid transport system substrate-binding protein
MTTLFTRRRAAVAVGSLLTTSAMAQTGKRELTFAQVLDLGPVQGAASKDLMLGSKLVIEDINSRGGMFGRRIKVETLDNGGDAKRMSEIVTQLREREDLFGIFSIRSTADTVMLAKGLPQVPIFASSTGADPVRRSLPPNVLFVRTTWSAEIDRLLGVVRNVGMKRIAVVYPEGAIGQAAQSMLDVLTKKHDLTVSGVATIPNPASTDVKPAAIKVAAMDAQVVIVALTGPAAEFMLAARRAGVGVPMYTLSDAISPEFVAKMRDSVKGIGFSAVFPSPWDTSFLVVREYQQAMAQAKRSPKDYSFSSLEGYINARLLIEVLKRVGPDVSRDRFIETARSLKIADFGGLGVDFTRANTALSFADVYVLSSSGRVMR